MEWWTIILMLFGGLIVLLALGLPVAFAFFLVNLAGAFFFMGGAPGLKQITLQVFDSVTLFVFLPVPLFILMGEMLYHSGVAFKAIDTLDEWIGRLPGRLGLMVIGSGTVFSALSGSTMANCAMLGAVAVPEMEKRGYSKSMSIGPIMGTGGLAMLIPPSALAVIFAALAQISVGKVLIAGAIPGVMIGIFYATYTIGRCFLQPHLAPPYDVPRIPLSRKLMHVVRYVFPLVIIVFLVVGVIFLGIATPTEAAATGCVGTFILAAVYKRLNRDVLKKSVVASLEIIVMVFMIIAASKTYSQLMAFTGASKEMVQFVIGQALPPILILISMQVLVFFLGTFMEQVSIMMIALPMFMPIVNALGFDPIWFAVIMLLNLEMALTTPPFGMLLYVMRGVAPKGTTMGDIIRAGAPYLVCDAVAMVLIIAFPVIATYLPSIMRY